VQLLGSDPRCDINAYCKDGVTALYAAVAGNDQEIAHVLIKQGALVNQPNANGDTPLFCAVRTQNVALTRVLLEGGARPNQWYFEGKLPTHVATADVLELLLSKGGVKGSPSFDVKPKL
jgi:ankyrin repeat protein